MLLISRARVVKLMRELGKRKLPGRVFIVKGGMKLDIGAVA